MKKKLRIRYVPIGLVKPDPKNPRRMDREARARLLADIERFGLTLPLIVRTSGKNYILVGGHQRLSIAKELGYDEVPVVVRDDLTAEESKALMIVLNNPRAQGTWDNKDLGSLLKEIADLSNGINDDDDVDRLLDATGFDDEIRSNLISIAATDASTKFLGTIDYGAGADDVAGIGRGDAGGHYTAGDAPPVDREAGLSFAVTLDADQNATVVGACRKAKDNGAESTAEALTMLAKAYLK